MPTRNGAVHVATTKKVYKGKTYVSHLLRRSVRKGDTVTHENLGNLSHLPEPIIEIVKLALKGQTFVTATDTFQVTRSLPHGHIEAILKMIRKLDLERLIASQPSQQRNLVVAMIVERLVFPSSKLANTRHWFDSTLAEELGVSELNENHLYSALDWLLQRQTAIEKKMAKRHLDEGAMVLYDITSSYYEGRHCPLAQFGHDRDGKSGRPIIVYGMLTDAVGRPIGVQVYPGNTGDPKTIPDQVETLTSRFGLTRVVLVGDRGMLTQTQISFLKTHPGLCWISALRSHSIRRLIDDGELVPKTIESVRLAEIQSPEFPDERLVACFNPALAQERARKRQELLEATEAELQNLAESVARRTRSPETAGDVGLRAGRIINHYKMAKHFKLTIQQGSLKWERRTESIEREKQLDGIYVIRTNVPKTELSASDSVRSYKRLTLVEQAFRSLKGVDLRVRPIFHRTPNHVRAHVFLCLLAYYVEWHLRKAWEPLLFEDEELEADRMVRDPIAPASSSESAKRKKMKGTTTKGWPVHSFRSLLAHLGTRCRNTCHVAGTTSQESFTQITVANPVQAEALRLITL